MARLGDTQRALMRSLKEHKTWHQHCGRIYGGETQTAHLMEGLLKRKMVKVIGYAPFCGQRFPIYVLTEAGLKEVES